MRCAWLAVVLAAACFHHIDNSNCADCRRDGGGDASPDVIDADDNCFGHTIAELGHLKVCPAMLPAPMNFTGTTIDTDTEPLCSTKTAQVSATGPLVCVIVGTDVNITGTLRGIGSYPLAIVATGTINVSSAITVGSDVTSVGIGAGGHDCGASAGTSMTGAGDGGGGAGGAFGTDGVAGGDALASAGGAAGIGVHPGVFDGGCHGGNGADAGGALGGRGGGGGGGIYLIARTNIVLAASIVAGGGGGGAGNVTTGGGGGGTGGMIGLDAPTISYGTGILSATGGGGGQGGGAVIGDPGTSGGGATAAPGGANPSDACGGHGGAGGASGPPVIGQSESSNACGGGGGGGSVGVIYVRGDVMGGTPIYVPNPS